MISKSIARFLVLFSAAGLIIGGNLSLGQTVPTKKSFDVSKYGALLEIFDENGESRFGKLTNNGFELSYQFKGKTVTVSAVGAEEANGLVAGAVKSDGQSATVTTTTSDHALEITTYFIVNEKKTKLVVQRRFKNISAEPVVVSTVQEYLDPALVMSSDVRNNPSSEKLVGLVRKQVSPFFITADCYRADCPKVPPPPCGPFDCPLRLNFDVARTSIRTNPANDHPERIIVPSLSTKTLGPLASKTKLQNNNVSTLIYLDIPPLTKIG
jgi:hypothetical protein